ncbi:XdhC family protein [Hydrogenibacillus schlegelii]|uniref:Xanthine dehydrogenase n=1 Tax=Hydrogenibacillus schlegelii TaxID=1484 RepID=A0A132MH89_HYDSH|nr:XdhC/CoxI family protein [Hydrogenibacillus schlegelii]KWW96771.1 xanthine dehydrogenase [Hydrogenibacillus schlegelii]OAR05420.1 xanthine dehydrogenase [Hydrogenibacillus schlegelii]
MSHIDEARQVFQRIEEAWSEGERAALLTITQVKGSSYRLPGAKMMMTESGKMLGSLSGGCLESDLYGWAEKAIKEEKPRLVQYDLSESEMWTLGIGCKGTMEVAIFPIHPDDPFWRAVREAVARDGLISLAIELPEGVRVLFNGTTPIAGDIDRLPESVREQLERRLHDRTKAEVATVDGRRFYIDTMRPNERLIICGAGHDAVPVAALAAKCRFRVTVLDPRKEFNSSARFPGAEHLVVEPDEADPAPLAGSWWLIMNHLQMRDEAALRLALGAQPKYIGVLGPLARTREMLENIGADLSSGPIHAPVGLSIGAETFEEVAVSIVAELVAVRSGQTGKPLHGKEKIHT